MASDIIHDKVAVKGRFAPSPSGRMHLGNAFTALLSWLSVRKQGGVWVLRIEDLDPHRSKPEYAKLIEDDLHWLGLDWDEGGLDDNGAAAPYSQSRRGRFYANALDRFRKLSLTYPCTCTRSDILATQAPHQSDGRVVYAGTCRPAAIGTSAYKPSTFAGSSRTERIFVPDEIIAFTDGIYGYNEVNLARLCGDFVLRRADGEWAYQLAVVVDDALMGITEVVRGSDLLLSAAQQIYLYRLLGYKAPRFIHVPLLCNADGRRLAKRDRSLNFEELRRRFSPEELVGRLAFIAGLTSDYAPCRPSDLIDPFSFDSVSHSMTVSVPDIF